MAPFLKGIGAADSFLFYFLRNPYDRKQQFFTFWRFWLLSNLLITRDKQQFFAFWRFWLLLNLWITHDKQQFFAFWRFWLLLNLWASLDKHPFSRFCQFWLLLNIYTGIFLQAPYIIFQCSYLFYLWIRDSINRRIRQTPEPPSIGILHSYHICCSIYNIFTSCGKR